MSTITSIDEQLKQRARTLIFSHRTLDYVIECAAEDKKQFFLECLDKELEVRKENKHARLIKQAHFPSPKGFADYQWDNISIAKTITKDELMEASFVPHAHNLVLFGPVGTGKTHLSIAIGYKACNLGYKVRYFTTSELVMTLSNAKREGVIQKLMTQIEKADLLILDEFGYIPIDTDGARLLFQVISKSYEQRSLIITTNIDFAKWGQILADNNMASAIIDRIVHHGHIIQFSGESYRLKHALMRA